MNTSADGCSIRYPDPAAEVVEWRLEYRALTDDELAALQDFFAAAEGSLNVFTMLDPTANLLSRSDHLDNPIWQKGPLLTIRKSDWAEGWHLTNTGYGPQSIWQTLAAPSTYLYCFSGYIRSSEASRVTMQLGDARVQRNVTSEWTRIVLASTGEPTFGLELDAGTSVEVFGLQAEPQGAPSTYQAGTTGGVYENSRLRDDALLVTTTGVNSHNCIVHVIHAKHL